MIIKKDNKYYLIPKPKALIGMRCICCNKIASEEHHIIYGRSNRKKSDEDGLTVALCNSCHWLLHNKHINDTELKKIAQRVYEKNHTRKEWMARYKKNYLWEEE